MLDYLKFVHYEGDIFSFNPGYTCPNLTYLHIDVIKPPL